MRNLHNIKEVSEILSLVRACDDARKAKEILVSVKSLARLAGQIMYYGWNDYYKVWSVGYMNEKPARSYLKHLAGLSKVYPDGSVSVWGVKADRTTGWTAKKLVD